MLSRCGDVVLVLTAVGLVLALIRRHADVDWVGLAWFDGSAVLAAIVGDIVVWRLIGMWPRGFGARGLEIARRGTELFPDAFRIRRRRAR
jgi:hypothetical protein